MDRIVEKTAQAQVTTAAAQGPFPLEKRRSPQPPQSITPRLVWGIERTALRRFLAAIGDPPLAIVLWTGEEVSTAAAPLVARVSVRDRVTLWKLVLDPLYTFGEAYSSGRLEVQGSLTDLLVAVYRRLEQRRTGSAALGRLACWFHRAHRSTLTASKENIHHHYDLGNEFYKLWLDEQMLYTCAYFVEPSMTLEQAQRAKMDHVCRKVRLREGQAVIEAGCGWGALAMHMASRYGVTVRAFNISHEQIVYARQEARRQGLDGRVEFIEDDWRNIQGCCDAFVSVGMLEHVGLANYGLLGDVIGRCLKEEGLGLIHTIGQNYPAPLNPWIERRIFPGACPPAMSQLMAVFEPHRFSVLDVENLRLHYAQTLRHWLDRYERATQTVRQWFDEPFVRAWRLYLAGSAAAFESGAMQLFQVLFTRQANNQIPWTRVELYNQKS